MKKIKLLLAFLLFAAATTYTYAQVGIGTAVPNQSAMLELSSSTKGLIIPRLSLTGNNDTATVTKGNVTSLLVYNTNTVAGANPVTPGFYYWDSTKWQRMATGDELSTATTAPAAELVGNTTNDFTFVNTAYTSILANAVTVAITITLPAPSAATKGKKYFVKKTDTNTVNAVTVVSSGTNITIDGQTSIVGAMPQQGWVFMNDGTSWYIVARI